MSNERIGYIAACLLAGLWILAGVGPTPEYESVYEAIRMATVVISCNIFSAAALIIVTRRGS